mmetsp:Transcript_10675/g.24882  ORF Transcript_10675/g.24882 Transcript_10675/m.24882 type:complete len:243 (+) Transcript_10675:1253-1981(+)
MCLYLEDHPLVRGQLQVGLMKDQRISTQLRHRLVSTNNTATINCKGATRKIYTNLVHSRILWATVRRILSANDEIAYLINNLPELPAIITLLMTKALLHLMTTMPVRGHLMMIEAILMATNVMNDRSTTIEAMRLATEAAPLEEAVDTLLVGAAVDAPNDRFVTIKAICLATEATSPEGVVDTPMLHSSLTSDQTPHHHLRCPIRTRMVLLLPAAITRTTSRRTTFRNTIRKLNRIIQTNTL